MVAEEMSSRSGFKLVHLGAQSGLTRKGVSGRRCAHDGDLAHLG
jgi:hypothetical protein